MLSVVSGPAGMPAGERRNKVLDGVLEPVKRTQRLARETGID